jgi:methyl-accepting chemotaxis protein
MPGFKSFSLHRLSGKLFFSLLFLVLLVAINGSATFYFLGKIEEANRLEAKRLAQLNHVQDVKVRLTQQAEIFESYVSTTKSGLGPLLRKELINSAEYLREIRPDFEDDGMMSPFSQFATNYQQVEKDYEAVIKSDISTEEARQLLYSTQGTRSRLFDDLDVLLKDRQTVFNTISEQNRNNLSSTIQVTLLVLITSIVIALVFALIIPRLLARSINALRQNLNDMANGNLTRHFEVKGSDEIVELGQTLNRATNRLRLVLARIQINSNTIATTSTYIEQASTEQASSLSQQAVAVSEVSATIGELSGTSQQIADSAALVANSASEALHSAESGYSTLQTVSQTMGEIITRVNQIADRIIALNTVAQRIREITTLISTLSDDTHLLALNAAIESAGAGEEGARFGVVAAQVRKLAQRSRLATVEIQQLVSQIQQATSASVMATEEGMKVAAVGRDMVENSLHANQEIIGLVQQTNQLAHAISLATDQQRLANNQVARTMQELAEMVSNISHNSQQYLSSANELSEVATQLNALVGIFKIREIYEETTTQIVESTAAADGSVPGERINKLAARATIRK